MLIFLLRWTAQPLKIITILILKPITLKLYRWYLTLKRSLNRIYAPAKNKPLALLTSRFAIHIIIVLLATLATAGNLKAQSAQVESFGTKSLLSTLIESEDEIIEENLTLTNGALTTSYLTQETAVAPLTAPGESSSKTEIPLEDLTATTQGDSALIKPTILPGAEEGLSKKRTSIVYYEVTENDTISQIAEQFGLSTNTILWENNLGVRDYIRPGDKLAILPTTGVTHKVKSGDTLSKIAQKYDVELEEIKEANRLTDTSIIGTSETLIIPGGQKIYPAPRRRSTLDLIKDIFVPPSAKVPVGSGMLWPTNGRTITQYFTWRHHGVDIDGDYSSPVYAAEAGTVEFNGWQGGYGLLVILDHGGGTKTRYGHFSKIFVASGQQVAKGETIGMVGSTGWSSGTHVHFEIVINGRKVNPLNYIQ